jgi:hypothetical protein
MPALDFSMSENLNNLRSRTSVFPMPTRIAKSSHWCGFLFWIDMIIRVAKRSPKFEPMRCYKKRKTFLSWCGFDSYKSYLKSEEWKTIRAEILKRKGNCIICWREAEQVHHLDYRPGTLLGLWPERLVSLCAACHKNIEFDENGEKLDLGLANGKLFHLACANGENQDKRRKWYRQVVFLERKRNKQHHQMSQKHRRESKKIGYLSWKSRMDKDFGVED